jgi:hypothetical protein
MVAEWSPRVFFFFFFLFGPPKFLIFIFGKINTEKENRVEFSLEKQKEIQYIYFLAPQLALNKK